MLLNNCNKQAERISNSVLSAIIFRWPNVTIDNENDTNYCLQLATNCATRILQELIMAIVATGHIEVFCPQVGHISIYLERIEVYITVKDITDAKIE